MKKIPTLLLALLILTAISGADTINLTSASGQIYPSNVAPGFSFDLRGSGYNFSFTALDNFNGDLVNCIPCEPTQLGNLFLAGGPYLYLNNQVFGWDHPVRRYLVCFESRTQRKPDRQIHRNSFSILVPAGP